LLRLGFDNRRGGCDRAFVEYYTVHGARIRALAYLLCGDWHRAEDLTQIVFTKLYRSWRRINREEVPQAYARQTLLRAFLDEQRKPWRREVTVGDFGAAGLHQPVDDPDVAAQVALRRVVADLPARQRAALVLRYWEDQPFEEVARVLGCTVSTARSLATRGVQALRRVMEVEPKLEQARSGAAGLADMGNRDVQGELKR
jgi:RNA polymerase sigma-70 factor (sigma-E family)